MGQGKSKLVARLMAGICVVSAVLAACGDGEDTSDCASGFKRCDGDCVADNLPEFGCAESSCLPCNVLSARASCNLAGECAIAACEEGFSDCNGDIADGCETDLRSDVENCGQCGNNCIILPWVGINQFVCGDSQCAILECEQGRRDDDGVRSNGCEVRVENEPGSGGAGGASGAPGDGGTPGAGGAPEAGGAAGSSETPSGAGGAAG
jgi:hypothetical protein